MSTKKKDKAVKKSTESTTASTAAPTSEIETEVETEIETEIESNADDASPTTEEAAPTAAELAEQLLAAQEEVNAQKEGYLRMAAELENVRRRAEKRITEAHQYALTDFALAISEVRDCLEVALDSPTGELDKMQEGVALTLRKLVAAMDARHILPIKPDIGVTFDPEVHMAIGQLPATAQAAADTVAAVVQAGYMLNGRVLRAANVMVAVAATNKTDK